MHKTLSRTSDFVVMVVVLRSCSPRTLLFPPCLKFSLSSEFKFKACKRVGKIDIFFKFGSKTSLKWPSDPVPTYDFVLKKIAVHPTRANGTG